MKLLTKELRQKLLKNDLNIKQGKTTDGQLKPVVKFFTPDAGATWLLTSLDKDNPDIAFGLCDLGVGFPELGYVSVSELKKIRGKLGLPVERDCHFTPRKTLKEYADEAYLHQHIQN